MVLPNEAENTLTIQHTQTPLAHTYEGAVYEASRWRDCVLVDAHFGRLSERRIDSQEPKRIPNPIANWIAFAGIGGRPRRGSAETPPKRSRGSGRKSVGVRGRLVCIGCTSDAFGLASRLGVCTQTLGRAHTAARSHTPPFVFSFVHAARLRARRSHSHRCAHSAETGAN